MLTYIAVPVSHFPRSCHCLPIGDTGRTAVGAVDDGAFLVGVFEFFGQIGTVNISSKFSLVVVRLR